MCVQYRFLWTCGSQKKALDSPRSRITGSCEPPDLSVRKWVYWISKSSSPLRSLSPALNSQWLLLPASSQCLYPQLWNRVHYVSQASLKLAILSAGFQVGTSFPSFCGGLGGCSFASSPASAPPLSPRSWLSQTLWSVLYLLYFLLLSLNS